MNNIVEYILRDIQTEWEIFESQGAVFGNARKSDLENFSIPWPEEVIRKTITHILGSLDDKIELNRRMNQTLEAMARAIFKSWFVDFDPVRAKAEGCEPGLPDEIAALFPDSFDLPAATNTAQAGTRNLGKYRRGGRLSHYLIYVRRHSMGLLLQRKKKLSAQSFLG